MQDNQSSVGQNFQQKSRGISAGLIGTLGLAVAGQGLHLPILLWAGICLSSGLHYTCLLLHSRERMEHQAALARWQQQHDVVTLEVEQLGAKVQQKDKNLEALTEQTPDLIARFDFSGKLLFANQAMEAALGVPRGILGTQLLSAWSIGEATRNCWQEVLQRIGIEASVIQQDFTLTIEQSEQWFDGCFVPEWDEGGKAIAVLMSARNITERKRIEQQIIENERMVQRIANASPNVLYIFDLIQQQCTYANRELLHTLGYSLEELQTFGMEMISRLTHPDDLEQVMAHHDEMLEANDEAHLEIEYRICHKQGGWRWLLSRDVVFSRTPEGLPRQILGTAQDITHRKQIEEQIDIQMLALNEYSLQLEMQKGQLEQANIQLEALAITDGLTGLKNIRAFQERLSTEFVRAKRYGEDFSLILLDVDRFKQYNDSFGHPAGDEVLKQVAQILQATARETDYVARYGGEEFIVYLPHTGAQGAVETAERLRMEIESATWADRPITVSIGVSHITQRVQTPVMLIEDADKALYSSKSGGRNRTTLHEVEHRWTAHSVAA